MECKGGEIASLKLPVFITLALILPANFSTTALIFAMVIMLTFIGRYPLKYIGFIIGSGIAMFAFFLLVAKAFMKVRSNAKLGTDKKMEKFWEDIHLHYNELVTTSNEINESNTEYVPLESRK